MIVKHIVVTLKPGMRAAFLEAQAVWNRGMAAHPGCLGGWVSDHPQDPRRIEITVAFRDQAALDAFMAGPHDALAEQTQIARCYEGLELRVYTPLQTFP